MHVGKGKLSTQIAYGVGLKETWIPWSRQGMTYFLCVFHEQATYMHNCDTVSQSGYPDIIPLFNLENYTKELDARLQTSGMTNQKGLDSPVLSTGHGMTALKVFLG